MVVAVELEQPTERAAEPGRLRVVGDVVVVLTDLAVRPVHDDVAAERGVARDDLADVLYGGLPINWL